MEQANDEALAARVHGLAVPIAEPLGIEVIEVQVRGDRGRRLVRITADALELDAAAGLDIDVIASLSRKLSSALDQTDPVDGGYTLEVSSPGADRPLRRPRDFARNIGRQVRVRHRVGDEVQTLSGELASATQEEITVHGDRDDVVVPLEGIEHAQVVLPW